MAAALLSILPGAGHLYKHHIAAGVSLLVLTPLMAVPAAVFMSFATLGLSVIVIPLAWWLLVGAAAWFAEDWHSDARGSR